MPCQIAHDLRRYRTLIDWTGIFTRAGKSNAVLTAASLRLKFPRFPRAQRGNGIVSTAQWRSVQDRLFVWSPETRLIQLLISTRFKILMNSSASLPLSPFPSPTLCPSLPHVLSPYSHSPSPPYRVGMFYLGTLPDNGPKLTVAEKLGQEIQ